MKLSVCIITCNEAERIERTLRAVRPVADEIVLVDSGSTDDTLKIAKKYGVRIFKHAWISYSQQKYFAQKKCRHTWILSIDADEVLSPELVAEIKTLKKTEPPYQAYQIKIADILPGMRYCRWTRTYNLIRLYHREYASFDPNTWTADRLELKPECTVGQLVAPVYHYSVLTIGQHVQKLYRYTDDVQEHIKKKKKKYSGLRLVTEFPLQFLIYYFIRRYFIHGRWGFIAAMNFAYARFLRIAKAVERQNQSGKVRRPSK